MLPLLNRVPLVTPDGAPIPYLSYVSEVPPPTINATPETKAQLIETFTQLAGGLSLPLIPGFLDRAEDSVWIRPPKLYIPTNRDILCFDWGVWILSTGYVMEST